jgi:general secretion pathway protein K
MPRPRKNEEGFILIAAIWLLLLAAVVVAVLMLRGYERSTIAATVSDRLQARLLLESAIETVVSDLLFSGSASRWSGLPATGSITLDGGSVAIEVSSENGRLDLNTIEPATLDTALRGFGVSALARDSVAAALSVRRQTKNPIATWADVEHVLAAPAADIAAKHCRKRWLAAAVFGLC